MGEGVETRDFLFSRYSFVLLELLYHIHGVKETFTYFKDINSFHPLLEIIKPSLFAHPHSDMACLCMERKGRERVKRKEMDTPLGFLFSPPGLKIKQNRTTSTLLTALLSSSRIQCEALLLFQSPPS